MRLRPLKIAAVLTLGLAAACTTTPTGRSQLMLVSEADMDRMGATAGRFTNQRRPFEGLEVVEAPREQPGSDE